MDKEERAALTDRIRKEEMASYQKLTENLRQRLDEEQKSHRQEMSDLHACYKQQVDDLKEKLVAANAAIGRECMSRTMLEKTNNTLNDLCLAMSEYDPERVLATVEGCAWSSPLSRIAQYHLTVLRRKIDLENRLESLAASRDNFNFD